MGLGKYLSESGERSSLRLNQFLATVGVIPVLLAIAFYIIWYAFHFKDIEWSAIALFLTACAGFFYQLWWGKAQNKKLEYNAQTKALTSENQPDNNNGGAHPPSQ